MRFHQAVTFLPADEILRLSAACDDMGYSGVYLSDHLFNPRDLASRYTYSKAPDGAPFWEKETAWPDPMCMISALSGVTTNLTFTTGIYIAPVRDLITVAKSVGTTAVLSHNRVRLGVGVGWCEEEFEQTGQDFRTRGKRLNDMIPALRALWQGGWVEYHGTHYDVPPCQMNPAPTQPVPILCGGDSEPALKRASTLCDGWINTGAASPDEAFAQVDRIKDALKREGRENDPFSIYVAVRAMPDLDLYHRLEDAGVTDLLCAPWMAVRAKEDDTPESIHVARLAACEGFAEHIIEAFG
ncbi:MAG: TIGR03619 family F420-dependent LLM class oxidoreductase [Acidimicrobiales bacterium]|jgi:probable F420-dependent oxidoreductase